MKPTAKAAAAQPVKNFRMRVSPFEYRKKIENQ
jgi:hypothetical protein